MDQTVPQISLGHSNMKNETHPRNSTKLILCGNCFSTVWRLFVPGRFVPLLYKVLGILKT